MDFNELVEKIAEKVLERISESENNALYSKSSMETVQNNFLKIEKRVITEQDIKKAQEQHVNLICITEKTIITDLARECAEQKNISFKIC